MRLKQLLGMALAGTVFMGGAISVSAAELDLAWYAKNNPDVVAAFGNSPEMLKMHYEMFGRKEARMANTNDVEAQLRRLFNAAEYATLNPDVKAAFGEDAEAMFQHYMAFGILEGRRPSERVSKDVAISIKKEVEKAMKKAGFDVTPGSLQLVAAITGMVQTDIGQVTGMAVQQALGQALTTATTPQKEEEKESGKSGYSIKKDVEGGYYIKVYNANDQLIKTQFYSDGQLRSVTEFEYNEQGQKIKASFYSPEGEFYGFEQYTYDAQGREKGFVEYDSVGKEQWRTDYTYDEDGLRTEKNYYYNYITDSEGQVSREERLGGEYKYDLSSDRLISSVSYDSDGKEIVRTTYKSDGSRTEVSTDYKENRFKMEICREYDANGNVTGDPTSKYYNEEGVEITADEYYGIMSEPSDPGQTLPSTDTSANPDWPQTSTGSQGDQTNSGSQTTTPGGLPPYPGGYPIIPGTSGDHGLMGVPGGGLPPHLLYPAQGIGALPIGLEATTVSAQSLTEDEEVPTESTTPLSETEAEPVDSTTPLSETEPSAEVAETDISVTKEDTDSLAQEISQDAPVDETAENTNQ